MQLCADPLRGAPGGIPSSVFAACLSWVLLSWRQKIKNKHPQKKKKSEFENSASMVSWMILATVSSGPKQLIINNSPPTTHLSDTSSFWLLTTHPLYVPVTRT